MKKFVAMLLVIVMTLSLVACGGDSAAGAGTQNATELVVWTLAKDLEEFSDRFMSQREGITIKTVVIEPSEYPTKVQSALLSGEKEPDIIVGEPQMLEDMYEAGFFEDLNQAPYNAQEYADKVVDYVWEVGQDKDGVQRAISYQITPAGIYYRRDIAKEVFGTDDPAEISKLFEDYPTILQTAQTLQDAGYRIFASDGEMGYFTGDTPWVVDGKLNVSQERLDFMDLAIDLYQKDYTGYALPWSAPWYQAMSGPIPVLTADTNVWDETAIQEAADASGKTTSVFAYGLPAWGVLVMRDNYGDTAGQWGVASGPAYGFGGGTFIGISANSERKELAWDFLKFCTLTEDTMEWWIEASNGDTVSYIPTLEKHKDDASETYGGQKLYQFWLEEAKGIDYSTVTKYDTVIGEAWNSAIESIKTEQMSREDALNDFYDKVASTYPELKVER